MRSRTRSALLTPHNTGRLLSAALIALGPALAHADGGKGGGATSGGGTDSAIGSATSGSGGSATAGGGGGGAGAIAGQGGAGGGASGAGGDGGYHGYVDFTLPATRPSPGVGTSGNDGNQYGGGGGAGGWGAIVTGAGDLGTATTIIGGNGGDGGIGAAAGGSGGSGGVGLHLRNANSKTLAVGAGQEIDGGKGGDGGNATVQGGQGGVGGVGLSANNLTLTNNGTIKGGDGGWGGRTNNVQGPRANGGDGIVGRDLNITNAGTIAGGAGGTAGNAITFNGGVNSLTLTSTSSITGNVVAYSASDTLALGGATNSTFDMGKVGGNNQYQNFGIFEKKGDSTWTLTGTTTGELKYVLSAGTLALGSSGALGSLGTIIFNGGTLQYSANNTTDYSNRFATTANQAYKVDTNNRQVTFASALTSQGGSLTKLGTGVLTLTANNTYTGTTTISGGTLMVGNGGTTGSLGSGNVVNNVTLVFNRSDTVTVSNNISGTGYARQSGTGTLILTGTNTYTGGTYIDAGGKLQVGNGGATGTLGSGLIDNKGILDFNRTGTLMVEGAISGSGTVTQSGTGTTVLAGASNTYSGATTVNAGTLEVDGTVTVSAITVNDGGTLSGTGKIGDPVINAGGTLKPGSAQNPLGTLTLAENLLMRAGSFFAVTIGPDGNSKVALTNGATASIEGAILKANFLPGTYIEKQYTLISGGNIRGRFVNPITTTNLPAGFTASTSYTSTSAMLDLKAVLGESSGGGQGSTSRGTTGNNPNQQAVANALNGAFNNGGSLPGAFTQVFNLTGTALTNALTQLSPQLFTQARSGATVSGIQFTSALLSCRVPGADTAVVMREGQCLWARGKESVTSVNTTDTDVGRRTRTNSFQAGAQVAIAPNWTLGGAIGYDQSWTESDTTSGTGDRINAGLALKHMRGPLQLVGSLSAGWGNVDSRRAVTVPGLPGTLRGSSDVDTYTAHARAAFLIDYGTWYLKPLVDMQLTRLDFSGLTESGGAAALQVAGSRDFIASVSPALEFGTNIALNRDVSLRPFVRTGITWGDQGSLSLDASFVGAPQAFTTTTVLDRVAADLALGFDLVARSGGAFRFEYEGRYGQTTTTSSFMVKGSLPF